MPEIPAGCRGEAGVRVYRGADRAARLRCALAFFRRGCALGHEKSCEAQRSAEKVLLEMAAGGPDR